MESIAKSLGDKRSELFRHRRAELACPKSAHPRGNLTQVISKVLEEREEPEDFDDSTFPPCSDIEDRASSRWRSIIIMSTCLAAMGAAAQLNLQIREPNYFNSLPNIWTLSIAESGSFKTAALNVGAKRLLERERELFSRSRVTPSSLTPWSLITRTRSRTRRCSSPQPPGRAEEEEACAPGEEFWEAVIDKLTRRAGVFGS